MASPLLLLLLLSLWMFVVWIMLKRHCPQTVNSSIQDDIETWTETTAKLRVPEEIVRFFFSQYTHWKQKMKVCITDTPYFYAIDFFLLSSPILAHKHTHTLPKNRIKSDLFISLFIRRTVSETFKKPLHCALRFFLCRFALHSLH